MSNVSEQQQVETASEPLPSIRVKRLNLVNLPDKPTLRAMGNIRLGHVTIHGVSLVEGKYGLFVGWPNRLNKNKGQDQWVEVVIPTVELQKSVNAAVIAEYQKQSGCSTSEGRGDA